MPRRPARPRTGHGPGGRSSGRRAADAEALLRVLQRFQAQPHATIHRMRQSVAGLCRLIGAQLLGQDDEAAQPPSTGEGRRLLAAGGPPGRPPPAADAALSPRMRQTLDRLLAGDSEKQIGRRLGISVNTIHVYVKALYRHYGANSRGELLSRFITPAP